VCGIFGIAVKLNGVYGKDLIRDTVRKLALLSESRGKDSSGLAFRNNASGTINIYKGPVAISDLIRDHQIQTEFDIGHGSGILPVKEGNENIFTVIGHARLVTNGSQLDDVNNQPVISDGVVGIHNGIIVNVDDLWKNNFDLTRKYEIDTEVMLSLIKKNDLKTQSTQKSIINTIEKIYGTVATAMLFTYKEELALTTNNGSLYFLTNNKDVLIFASEKFFLTELFKNTQLKHATGTYKINQLQPNSGLRLDLSSFAIQNFVFSNQQTEYDKIKFNDNEFAVRVTSIGSDKENRPVIVDVNKIRINPAAAFERKLLVYNITAIRNLKRCFRCLLPETFPFICFDDNGVCNYCKNYKIKNQPKPVHDLIKLIEPFKRSNGEPDCIIPFSGGRDSTFTLHCAKKVLGLNPLAFTYDWGMVTDLARRNIARVCGTLGVENIIVAADIRQKRENIKKNILAWLKSPHLGMIPLFMAGDKFFFYYTNQLKKQTGITLNIWGVNPLENTDFKTGFAGIKPDFDKKRIYSLSTLNQVKLFRFAGKNIIASPRYFNSSVLDTLGSFAARFIAPKKDYFHLFDFYKWDENEIESLILNEYGWEKAIDTNSTWRIGDGTAGFYNYIYTTIAGFSENDTFRSNQIREGMISREKAMELVEYENIPRYETIKWYLNIVGLDYERTIRRINDIPKLYAE